MVPEHSVTTGPELHHARHARAVALSCIQNRTSPRGPRYPTPDTLGPSRSRVSRTERHHGAHVIPRLTRSGRRARVYPEQNVANGCVRPTLRPTTNDQRPTTNDQRPTTKGQRRNNTSNSVARRDRVVPIAVKVVWGELDLSERRVAHLNRGLVAAGGERGLSPPTPARGGVGGLGCAELVGRGGVGAPVVRDGNKKRVRGFFFLSCP